MTDKVIKMKTERNSHADITWVVTLNQNDVICGRGTLALKHPGNIAFRKFVRENKVLYATRVRHERNEISKRIIASIRNLNGRFLVREDGLTSSFADEKDVNGNPVIWRDIGDKKATEKTSQALREKSYKNKRAPKRDVFVVVNHTAIFNPVGIVHQSWIMPQTQARFSPAQTLEENYASQLQLQRQNIAQVNMFGLEPSVQNALPSQQHQNTAYPQNSFGENSVNPRSQSDEVCHESRGSQNSSLYCKPATERIYERNKHTFSADGCQQLTLALSLDREVRTKQQQKLRGKSGSPYLHLATKKEQLSAERSDDASMPRGM